MFEQEIQEHPKIRLSGKSSGHNKGCSIEFSGLSAPELAALESALIGANWVRIHDGRLAVAHAYEQSPELENDPECGPFFATYGPQSKQQTSRNIKKIKFRDPEFAEPGIHISALGAGQRHKDAYESNVLRLESWGFECLRSRRGENGKFWEIWYLPSLLFAEGELAKAIAEVKSTKANNWGDVEYHNNRLEAAIRFLCKNANFGSLDAFIQRAALTYD